MTTPANPTPPVPSIPAIPPETEASIAKFLADVLAVAEKDAPTLLGFLASENLKGEKYFVGQATEANPYLGMLASGLGGEMLRIMGTNEQAILGMCFLYLAKHLQWMGA